MSVPPLLDSGGVSSDLLECEMLFIDCLIFCNVLSKVPIIFGLVFRLNERLYNSWWL